jgi:hypothetical protein
MIRTSFCWIQVFFVFLNFPERGPDSSVGIATRYGLDGPGIKTKYPVVGEIFRTFPDRPWGPPSLLYNGYRVFLGCKVAGAWCWPPPILAPRSRMSGAVPLLPLWSFVACYRAYIFLNFSESFALEFFHIILEIRYFYFKTTNNVVV